MAKGIFTQCRALLTDRRMTLDGIRSALKDQGFDIIKESPAQEHWPFGGPSLLIPFLPDVNGYATVDLVNQPWPDAMGDPKSDSMTFAAWSMGYFGPHAYPGGLARARQHAWNWEPGRTIAEGHSGFLRARISYVFGLSEEATVLPEGYDPLAEMMFLDRVLLALLNAPGVLCYFNPNGEVLRDGPSFHEVWAACRDQESIPLPLWANIRFFNLSEKLAFMDTVGNAQLDIQDVEAFFPTAAYDPGDVDYYLRNVTHYLLDLDREIQSGEMIDGPGETDLSWTIDVLDESVVEPPRPVLRLYPKSSRAAVRASLASIGRG